MNRTERIWVGVAFVAAVVEIISVIVLLVVDP